MEIQSVTACIKKYQDFQRELNRQKLKNTIFFRGQNKECPKLIPSIYHKGLVMHENEIYHEIIAEFPEEMSRYPTTIEKQIVMQHYELPSRILDISKNPLVALFFACYQEEEYGNDKTDGIIYVFSVPNHEIKFCDSDSVTAIINLCKCHGDFSIKHIKKFSSEEDKKKFNEDYDIKRLIHFARDDKPFFAGVLNPDTLGKVVCLHPAMNNTRIIRQDGYFFVFGIDGDKKNCAQIEKKWIAAKLKVPYKYKQNILKELESFNINASRLFADYRHMGKHLQKKYAH